MIFIQVLFILCASHFNFNFVNTLYAGIFTMNSLQIKDKYRSINRTVEKEQFLVPINSPISFFFSFRMVASRIISAKFLSS